MSNSEVWLGHPAIIGRKAACSCDNVITCKHLMWDFRCPYCDDDNYFAEAAHILGPYSCDNCGKSFMVMVEGWVDRTTNGEQEEEEEA